MEYINTWGVYPCFQGTNDDMIVPDCREEFFALRSGVKVFECISSNGEMITLKYGRSIFQVNSKLYKKVREPKYKVGDKVKIVEKSLIAQIIDVNWHFKDDAPFYFVEIDGKKWKKRYRDCDLMKAN